MVYVLNINGRPLCPTNNHAKVRILLKSKKAKVVNQTPFTIQLLYEIKNPVVTEYILGLDPGLDNIGVCVLNKNTSEVVYKCEVQTRTKEIKSLMQKRKMYRQQRHQHIRQKKQRRAVKSNPSLKSKEMEIIYPGQKEPTVKKITRGYESQYNNRKRPDGWLTPTANHCLQTHINVIKKVMKILPISEIDIEYASFDFQKLDNININSWDYQKGLLYGFKNVNDYIDNKQDCKCLLCKTNKIKHLHHIVAKSQGGSDTASNLAGLCEECHNKVHHDNKYNKKLLSMNKGKKTKYRISTLNIVMPALMQRVQEEFNYCIIKTQKGYDTKLIRDSIGLSKEFHSTDALCIILGCNHLNYYRDIENIYFLKQFRRHNRAYTNALIGRHYKQKYKDKNGKEKYKTVAINRKPLILNGKKLTNDSLEDYLAQFSNLSEKQKVCSQLIVLPGYTRELNKDEKITSGCIAYHKKSHKRYLVSGRTAGFYFNIFYVKGNVLKRDSSFKIKDYTFYICSGLQYV